MTSSADMAAKSVVDPARWRFAATGDPQTLAKARAVAINIAQWLARIANSYVAARAPDERVLLVFRAADAAFATKTFGDGLSLEMRLPSLEMQFLENGHPAPHILDPEEHSPAEVEAWLLVELLHRGVDRAKFTKQLPYSIPNLMSGDAEDYSPQTCQEGLTGLKAWLENAARILEATARASASGKVAIVCRPQTLELSCIMDSGSKPASFGFSPGDGRSPEPYFYRDTSTGNGKRSILTASQLLAENDPANVAITFMRPAAG
jgi:hypothetical protein